MSGLDYLAVRRHKVLSHSAKSAILFTSMNQGKPYLPYRFVRASRWVSFYLLFLARFPYAIREPSFTLKVRVALITYDGTERDSVN